MNVPQVLGFSAFAIGVLLLVFGLDATDTPLDQVYNSMTGRYTDTTMWYIVGGFAAIVLGSLVFLLRRQK